MPISSITCDARPALALRRTLSQGGGEISVTDVHRVAHILETTLAQPVLLCWPTLRPHLWRRFHTVPSLKHRSSAMTPQRFRSSSVRDALAQAREALGPSALVFGTRLVPTSGWRGWLAFRDHLRANPADAAEYGQLKRELADRHAADRPAYRAAKAPFIERVLAATR